MEPCVRGFSYMPNAKAEVMDLQYIEGGELERTWKVNRRQRLKEQEQKIWEEFVKEQDIVKTACTEDPYQFLHQLPENCLKELMETELQKMRKEMRGEDIAEQPTQGEGDQPTEKQALHSVAFTGDDKDAVFHIFDNENDLHEEISGPEEEAAVDSPASEPSTVRERRDPSPLSNDDVLSGKSSEHVPNLIESSINCARVKDLRMKINDELLAIMTSLDSEGVAAIESSKVSRVCRRSAEFCGRFHRIHLYQLQRQMHDIQRAVSATVPFAAHTQYQAQMSRIVSLHQNLLQAIQIFHKSFEQTWCLGESGAMLHTLLQFTRDMSTLCNSVPTPKDFAAAHELYTDELWSTSAALQPAAREYSSRVAHLNVDNATNDNSSTSISRLSKSQGKPGKRGRASQAMNSSTKTWSTKDTEARLSMYSLDTARPNLTARGSSSREHHASGPKSKTRVPESAAGSKVSQEPNCPRNTPRSRRPLMRAPVSRQPRAKPHADTDIPTMVEAVGACASSHMSREVSPHRRPRDTAQRTSQATTPRLTSRQTYPSPRENLSLDSPKPTQIKKVSKSNRNDRQNIQLSKIPNNTCHVTKIQCAKKEPDNDKTEEKTAKSPKNNGSSYSSKDSNRSKDVAETSVAVKNTTKNHNDKITGNIHETSRIKHVNTVNADKGDNTGKDCGGVKVTGSTTDTDLRSSSKKNAERDGARSERERNRASSVARCEVSTLLRQLCSGDGSGSRNEKVTGAKNAQLFCMSGSTCRQPSTPQLLRILEETIQKKAPRPMYQTPDKDPDRYRLAFNIPEKTTDQLFQYRTKFVQHMLTSPMYANSAVGKPWEMIGSVSEKIIDELLLNCAKEMEIKQVLQELYDCETK